MSPTPAGPRGPGRWVPACGWGRLQRPYRGSERGESIKGRRHSFRSRAPALRLQSAAPGRPPSPTPGSVHEGGLQGSEL